MAKITKRDRLTLMVGGIFVIFFLVMQFAVFPLLENRKKLRNGIETREINLAEMQKLQVRYRDLHNQADSLVNQLDKRQSGFDLFAFMEQNAARAGVKENISSMKPSEMVDDGPFKEIFVEMKLQSVSLKQLVDFLTLTESPNNIVALKRISIQENKKEEATLDVILQVVSLERNPDWNLE